MLRVSQSDVNLRKAKSEPVGDVPLLSIYVLHNKYILKHLSES